MGSIGRKRLSKCTHPGCGKPRPYWSLHCKEHRVKKNPDPRPSRWRDFIGYEIRDRKNSRLGKITAIDWDSGQWWATINDDHEAPLNNAREVIELNRGKTYIQLG